jgi:pantetheine-phosphate adenylyltransferase
MFRRERRPLQWIRVRRLSDPPLSIGALYPGTFDPITHGHEDLIRRSAVLFDRVVVAVAASPKKTPLLALAERISLAREVLHDLSGVEVTGYAALTVDFAREHSLGVIVRGLRTASDFEYEFQLATMNAQLDSSIDTVLLTPTPEHTFISASLVREIAEHGGDISAFVHPAVAARLKEAFAMQSSERTR